MCKSTNLADKLYQLRTIQRISQAQLASAIGVQPSMYNRIERGIRRIKLNQLEILAHILKTDIKHLYSLWLADKFLCEAQEMACDITIAALAIVKTQLNTPSYEAI